MSNATPPTFFISVASFCDPYLLFTLNSAVTQARYPDRLNLGVVEQSSEPSVAALRASLGAATLRYTHIHPVQSRGVCWARSLAFALYQGEDLLLQIDSHTWFEPDWDIKLTENINLLRDWSRRPVLTTYPWGFEFDEAGKPYSKNEADPASTLVLKLKPGATLQPEDARLAFQAVPVSNPSGVPLPGIHVAGGFLLTDGAFVEHVPYDPLLYFHGEEQSLAIRAYTRGWDIFHMPSVPLYHLYKMPKQVSTAQHWNPEWEKQRDFRFSELDRQAKHRLADLLYQRRNLGVYGLGSERSLKDYAAVSGIDYLSRTIGETAQANLGLARQP